VVIGAVGLLAADRTMDISACAPWSAPSGSPDRRHGPSPEPRVAQGLRAVGVTIVASYLGERLGRQRLRPSGWDALESPPIVTALGLSVGMAAFGHLRPTSGTEPA
jgi:hypothetical protein